MKHNASPADPGNDWTAGLAQAWEQHADSVVADRFWLRHAGTLTVEVIRWGRSQAAASSTSEAFHLAALGSTAVWTRSLETLLRGKPETGAAPLFCRQSHPSCMLWRASSVSALHIFCMQPEPLWCVSSPHPTHTEAGTCFVHDGCKDHL